MDLPSNLQVFAADLSDMFPGGIIDTKYISDYITKEPVSFLSYLFKKYEREERRRQAMLQNPDSTPQQKRPKKFFLVEIQPPFPIERIIEGKGAQEDQGSAQADGSASRAIRSKKRRRRNKSSVAREEKPYCEQYAVSCQYILVIWKEVVLSDDSNMILSYMDTASRTRSVESRTIWISFWMNLRRMRERNRHKRKLQS
jgi:target of EGR1 protein 1